MILHQVGTVELVSSLMKLLVQESNFLVPVTHEKFTTIQ